MDDRHRRNRPERPSEGRPSGPSNATLLIASVLLVALLSFALGYLTRGSGDEEVAPEVAEVKAIIDTPATTLDSGHILESTGVADPTPDPTPQFIFTQTLNEETADQAAVPRSDSPPPPPVPTAAPTIKPTPKPTPAPAKPKVKPTPAPKASTPTPPKPTVTPTPSPKKPGASSDTYYSVQIAAVGDRNEAARLRIQLGGKGYHAYVIPFFKGGKTYYRVRIGPFSSRAAAEREAKKLETQEGYKNPLISADER